MKLRNMREIHSGAQTEPWIEVWLEYQPAFLKKKYDANEQNSHPHTVEQNDTLYGCVWFLRDEMDFSTKPPHLHYHNTARMFLSLKS